MSHSPRTVGHDECWAPNGEFRWADFCELGVYRWELGRVWDGSLPQVVFCGLNPSKAGARFDDATVRLWRGIAKRLGFGGFTAVNAYAVVETYPRLLDYGTAKGQRTDEALRHVVRQTATFVACWGAGCERRRQAEIVKIVRDLGRTIYVLGFTQDGFPRHPRGIPRDAQLLRAPTSWPSELIPEGPAKEG